MLTVLPTQATLDTLLKISVSLFPQLEVKKHLKKHNPLILRCILSHILTSLKKTIIIYGDLQWIGGVFLYFLSVHTVMMHLGSLLDLMKRQDFLNRLLWELKELIKVKIFKLPQKEQVLKAMLVIITVISQEPILDARIHLCRNTDRQSQQKQIYSALLFGPWPLHHPSFPLHKRRASQIWLPGEIIWGEIF